MDTNGRLRLESKRKEEVVREKRDASRETGRVGDGKISPSLAEAPSRRTTLTKTFNFVCSLCPTATISCMESHFQTPLLSLHVFEVRS